jgi:hypothetical protein
VRERAEDMCALTRPPRARETTASRLCGDTRSTAEQSPLFPGRGGSELEVMDMTIVTQEAGVGRRRRVGAARVMLSRREAAAIGAALVLTVPAALFAGGVVSLPSVVERGLGWLIPGGSKPAPTVSSKPARVDRQRAVVPSANVKRSAATKALASGTAKRVRKGVGGSVAAAATTPEEVSSSATGARRGAGGSAAASAATPRKAPSPPSPVERVPGGDSSKEPVRGTYGGTGPAGEPPTASESPVLSGGLSVGTTGASTSVAVSGRTDGTSASASAGVSTTGSVEISAGGSAADLATGATGVSTSVAVNGDTDGTSATAPEGVSTTGSVEISGEAASGSAGASAGAGVSDGSVGVEVGETAAGQTGDASIAVGQDGSVSGASPPGGTNGPVESGGNGLLP